MKGSTKLWLSIGIVTTGTLFFLFTEEVVKYVSLYLCRVLTYILITIIGISTFLVALIMSDECTTMEDLRKEIPILFYSNPIGWIHLIWLGK